MNLKKVGCSNMGTERHKGVDFKLFNKETGEEIAFQEATIDVSHDDSDISAIQFINEGITGAISVSSFEVGMAFKSIRYKVQRHILQNKINKFKRKRIKKKYEKRLRKLDEEWSKSYSGL